MSLDLRLPALRSPARREFTLGSRIGAAMVVRAAFAALVLAAALLSLPALAAERPGLRGDITATGDVLTLGEIVAGAPADLAGIPVFRAPALGQKGTIQTSRIVATAESLGLGDIETYGRPHINVMRAARRVGHEEIAAALTLELARRHALDAANLSIQFDGGAPALLVGPEVVDPVRVMDLSFNPVSRRVAGIVYIGPNAAQRHAHAVISGAMIETVEIGVLNRSIARGEPIRAGDVAVERRPRDSIPADARMENIAVEGHVARRPLAAGAALRQGDLMRPDLVARGENVLIIYRSRGLTLTMRGSANEAGALGDVINVTNPQSRRTLQATVSGPGQVVVNAPSLGPFAATGRMQ